MNIAKIMKIISSDGILKFFSSFKTNPLIPKTPHEQKDLPFRGGVQAAEL